MFLEFSQLALGKAYVLPVFPQFLTSFFVKTRLTLYWLLATPLTGIMKDQVRCTHPAK